MSSQSNQLLGNECTLTVAYQLTGWPDETYIVASFADRNIRIGSEFPDD
ncbi:MAG: hypothetical protein HN867_05670 [Deltaproteobacteria bacterium]|nr:hypothetical protein [Deltaproteobacteria bacterium]